MKFHAEQECDVHFPKFHYTKAQKKNCNWGRTNHLFVDENGGLRGGGRELGSAADVTTSGVLQSTRGRERGGRGRGERVRKKSLRRRIVIN